MCKYNNNAVKYLQFKCKNPEIWIYQYDKLPDIAPLGTSTHTCTKQSYAVTDTVQL